MSVRLQLAEEVLDAALRNYLEAYILASPRSRQASSLKYGGKPAIRRHANGADVMIVTITVDSGD